MIDPHGLDFRDWADAVVLSLNAAWPFGAAGATEDWQNWAVGLVRAPPLAQRVLPDPYQFTDWRDWAERVAPMLEDQS